MNVLAITTSEIPSFALDVAGKRYFFEAKGKNRGEELFVCLRDSLFSLGLKIRDIDKIVVDIGPGSFTGLRIGLAAIKTWAFLFPSIKLYPFSCLDVMADKVVGKQKIVVKDAGRNMFYVGAYRVDTKRYYLQNKEEFWMENDSSTGEQIPIIEFSHISAQDCLFFYFKNEGNIALGDALTLKPIYIYPDDCSVNKKK